MSDSWKVQDDEASMPIGTGSENTASEIPFPADKKPKVQAMTLVLILIFAGGLGLIYSVGMLHKPRAADASQTATESQINSALDELASKAGTGRISVTSDTDKLVKMFYEYPGKASLPLEALPSNPFEHQGAVKPVDIGPVKPAWQGPDVHAEELERQRKLAESFKQLKLQTVVVSTGFSMAQINGKLLKVGAKIGEFTIDSIEQKRVIVKNGDDKFELLLNQPDLDQ